MFEFFKRKETPVDETKIAYIKEYIEWLESQTKKFLDELSKQNFNLSWGFEVYKRVNTLNGETGFQDGKYFIFDIQPMEVVAFDSVSKQMAYIKCGKGHYTDFYHSILQYEYVLIPYSQIFKVTLNVNSKTVYECQNGKEVFKQSVVGAIIAGEAGAIIGSNATNKEFESYDVPQKLEFCIQTTNELYPIIEFTFNNWVSDYGSEDTKYHLFSNNTKPFTYSIKKQKRNLGTDIDCYISRESYIYKYDGNNPDEYEPVMDYISYSDFLEILIKRFTKYSRQIESIIKQN